MTDNYKIGFKKPPTDTQFKKGLSGNPKGRPKGGKNIKTDLLEELQEQILIREGPLQKQISKQRGMLKGLMAKAVKGDTRAANLILNMIFRLLEVDTPEEEADLSSEDQSVIENFEAKITRKIQGKKTESSAEKSKKKAGKSKPPGNKKKKGK